MEDLSEGVTFKQDGRLRGSRPQQSRPGEEVAGSVLQIKGSMCKGPQMGSCARASGQQKGGKGFEGAGRGQTC